MSKIDWIKSEEIFRRKRNKVFVTCSNQSTPYIPYHREVVPMKGQTIIGETRFIINGQLYSPEQIGEQRAMELIRQKVDQAMEGIGFEKTYKEKTA